MSPVITISTFILNFFSLQYDTQVYPYTSLTLPFARCFKNAFFLA